MFENLEHLDKLTEEINSLKRRSKLLEIILSHYDYEKMEFNVPDKWKGRIRHDKLPAESPKHHLDNQIRDILTYEELSSVGIY